MKQEIFISKKKINEDSPFIIAEAGVNHNGSLSIAKKLIRKAKIAGADAIKFQTFKTEKIILPKAPKSNYHIETTGSDKSQSWFDLLKSQELNEKMHIELKKYCNEQKIIFLSTPYDFESVDLLEKIKIPAYKIASTDNVNYPLLKYIAKKNKPVILSTGMNNMKKVEETYNFLKKYNSEIIILQCTANYPIKLNDVNLNVMDTYKKRFKCFVGFSDHTIGNFSSTIAAAMGASIIEKHFTLDKKMAGPDHRMSATPKEFKMMIETIKLIQKIKGSFEKKILSVEKLNKKRLQKSLVTEKAIKKDQIIKKKFLSIKRPGYGLEPKMLNKISNFRASRDIKAGVVLKSSMIKSK